MSLHEIIRVLNLTLKSGKKPKMAGSFPRPSSRRSSTRIEVMRAWVRGYEGTLSFLPNGRTSTLPTSKNRVGIRFSVDWECRLLVYRWWQREVTIWGLGRRTTSFVMSWPISTNEPSLESLKFQQNDGAIFVPVSPRGRTIASFVRRVLTLSAQFPRIRTCSGQINLYRGEIAVVPSNVRQLQTKVVNISSMVQKVFDIVRLLWTSLLNPIQGRGGGGHIVPPPPPGKLSKISQERLELRSWNFLTFQMNKFSKNPFGFQLSPPTLGYHSNAQRWRMFSNNIFQQFSCKISPELERFLVYLWRGVLTGICCEGLG